MNLKNVQKLLGSRENRLADGERTDRQQRGQMGRPPQGQMGRPQQGQTNRQPKGQKRSDNNLQKYNVVIRMFIHELTAIKTRA